MYLLNRRFHIPPLHVKAYVNTAFATLSRYLRRSIFKRKDNAAAYRNAFSIGKADPFRPLVNLLDDRSIKTNIRNVDLLALLIDFQPRPYHPNLQIQSTTGASINPARTGIITGEPPLGPGTVNPGGEITKGNSYKFLWIFMAVIIAGMSWWRDLNIAPFLTIFGATTLYCATFFVYLA
ncbi:MAG: hypothetical protein ACTHMI_04210 [Mucilaginibacter sp.]